MQETKTSTLSMQCEISVANFVKEVNFFHKDLAYRKGRHGVCCGIEPKTDLLHPGEKKRYTTSK